MIDSLSTFIKKTKKMESELHQFEKNMVVVAAQAVKNRVLDELVSAGVQNGRLRGVGKKGAKIGVRYDFVGPAALVRATGPFHLIERNTKAHRIGQKKSASGLPIVDASGQDIRKVYTIPGVGFRAWADHPGTKGKYPWAKGVEAARPEAQAAGAVAMGKSIAKAYR